MPNVSSLLDSIKDLALVGSGNSADTDRIMRYMNMVYKEAYRVTAVSYPTLLLTSETVTITSGAGTITTVPFSIMRVKDTDTNILLEPSSRLDIEDMSPSLNGTGNPTYYFMESEMALKTYPIHTGSVLVRYIPRAGTLTSASAETDIKIPPEFHEMLLWGTLVYMAYDERDKSAAGEVNIAQSKYELALNDYKAWLVENQTSSPIRTKAYMGG
jgi:hypothetical protein